jgi:hypothetical protein
MVDLKKFDPNAKGIRILNTKSEQPIVDITDKLKYLGRPTELEGQLPEHETPEDQE